MIEFGDSLIQSIVAALNEDTDTMDDLPVTDWPTDPVARLTEGPDEERPTLPSPVPQPAAAPLFVAPQREQERERTFAQQQQGTPAAFRAGEESHKQNQWTTGDFTRAMLAREGSEYEWGGTTRKGGFDCSGIIWRIMQNRGFTNFPRTSGEIIAHAKPISVKKAIKTRGAVLWHDGHIAVSLGNGKTIEAMGEAYGVLQGDARGRFTKGGILPEMQLGKALIEASRSKLRQRGATQPLAGSQDPLNRTGGVSSLVSAPTVFGSVMGEVQGPSPSTQREWQAHASAPGLHFVPAKYRGLFQRAGNKYGLSPRLLAYVAQHESGFNPKAVSSAGAQGMMQVMPLHDLQNPFNARANVFKGAEILAGYMSGLGLRDGLAAYNAGPGNAPGQADRDADAWEAGLRYADSILDSFLGRAA